MALPKTFKEGECPDYLAEYYTKQDDGSFALNDGMELDNVGGLRKALGASKDKADKLLKIAKNYGKVKDGTWEFDPSVDPEENSKLAKQLKQLEEKYTDEDGKPIDLDKLVAERSADRFTALQQAHEKALADQSEKSAEALNKLLNRHKAVAIDQQIDNAILEHKGKAQFIRPHVRSLAELDEDFNLVLKDPEGKPLMDADGKNQSVSSFVKELRSKDDWADAFHAETASGGGNDPRNTPRYSSGGLNPESELTEGAEFI